MSDIQINKTGEPDIIQASDGRLTLSVPIQIKRRSGRKLVTLPNGDTAKARPWDNGDDTTAVGPGQRASPAYHAGVRGSQITQEDRLSAKG